MKRLLVFRFSAMGDVAMTVPILYSLVKQYPELQITIVSRAAFQPFFEQLPENISFVAADLYGKHKGIRGLYRLYRELHEMKFDAVADLHNVLRTFFLRWCFRSFATISSPSNRTPPCVGTSSPPSRDSSVVLPDPDGPRMAYIFPVSSDPLTFCKTALPFS